MFRVARETAQLNIKQQTNMISVSAGQKIHSRSISARCRGWLCHTQTRPGDPASTDSMAYKVCI